MTLKYITLRQLLSWKPCPDDWPEERILQAAGGRRRMTPLEICDLPDVPIADKFWLLLRPAILPERELRRFQRWCVKRLRHDVNAARAILARTAWPPATAEAVSRAVAWTVAPAVTETSEATAAWGAARDAERTAQLRHLRLVLRRLTRRPIAISGPNDSTD